MAAHSNNKNFLGDGLQWNVRSYLFERVLDFSLMGTVDPSAYYEIGTLPKGFVPRNVAIIELAKVRASGTVDVYSTVEDAESGSATKLASLAVGGATPGFVAAALATANAQLAVKAGAAFTGGKVKIAISGDLMTGYWDDSLGATGDFDAGEYVQVNTVES
ncbi:MAG: hypothetical protein ACI4RA_03510 [Kiritimatiellia bacterium]